VTLPGSGGIVTFKYDPLGRRIEKVTPAGTFRYVYDNEDIIAVLDVNNTLTQAITHGPGIDEPLILKNADTSANYYYHADGLGSITAISNETGEIIETVEYHAYGKPTIKDHTGAVFDASPVGNLYLFTAREYDHETGLYYFRERYEAPEMGTFLQEDGAEVFDGASKFPYALNNPVNYTDSSGLLVDVFADLYFIISDIHDILESWCAGRALSPGFLALGLDIGGAFIPGVTGLGKGGKYLFDNWHQATFKNRLQSLLYHLGKHGKGRTASEYTKAAQNFFKLNQHRAIPVVLKDGTKGWHIKGQTGGYWTETGQIVSFWD
jgi:RHS repeat-associated protein